MKVAGIILTVLGLLMVFAAFNMDTSVSSFDGSSVNNLGLLQQQLMVLQTGLAAFVAGIVLYSAGEVAENGPTRPVNVPPVANTHEETEEDKEQRLASVRDLNRTIGLCLLGLITLIIVVIIIMSLR